MPGKDTSQACYLLAKKPLREIDVLWPKARLASLCPDSQTSEASMSARGLHDVHPSSCRPYRHLLPSLTFASPRRLPPHPPKHLYLGLDWAPFWVPSQTPPTREAVLPETAHRWGSVVLHRLLLFLTVLSLGQVRRRQTVWGGGRVARFPHLGLSQSIPGLRPDHAWKVSGCISRKVMRMGDRYLPRSKWPTCQRLHLCEPRAQP